LVEFTLGNPAIRKPKNEKTIIVVNKIEQENCGKSITRSITENQENQEYN